MDSITHALLGAVTAQLGFRQKIGRDATWVAAGAAILLDLDIFVAPFLSLTGTELDPTTAMTIHRGLSHSLLMTPVLALVVTLVWWRMRKRSHAPIPAGPAGMAFVRSQPTFLLLYACTFVAMLTHPLLDWFTTYGTQLLAPLSSHRYALDAVPIVDIIYTPILLLTLLICRLIRRATFGHGARATLAVGWLGFALSCGYLMAGRGLHDLAVDKAVRSAGDGHVLRAGAYPAVGTIFLWRAVVETEQEWVAMRIHHFDRTGSETWCRQSAPRVDNGWIRKARDLREVATYYWFASDMVRPEYSEFDGNVKVVFNDMRYAWPLDSVESFWPLMVIYDREGEVLHVGRTREALRGSFGSLVARSWQDIWNPTPQRLTAGATQPAGESPADAAASQPAAAPAKLPGATASHPTIVATTRTAETSRPPIRTASRPTATTRPATPIRSQP